jgi:hypothetical protein
VQFLNPLVLAGLAAALVPLAIHLLQQGRKRPQPFSNLAFLRSLNRSHMRRLRLRQWLVLLLRTLIIALIVAAFARPTYQEGGFWGGGASSAVVLLDRSFSSRYLASGISDFSRLQRRATEVLALFGSGDHVQLVSFGTSIDVETGTPEQLTERVKNLQPSQEATDLQGALAQAERFLNDAPQENRELFILSDLARRDWLEIEPKLDSNTTVYLPRPAGPRPNTYLAALSFDPWLAASGTQQPLALVLSNASNHPAPAVGLDVYLDGERVDHREIDLAPGEERPVEFAVAPRRAGRLDGYVSIDEDGLDLDGKRYFSLEVPDAVNVLLLGEQPGDTYYLRRALAAAAQGDPALKVQAALHANWDTATLATTDVVFICNLRRLDDTRIQTLQRFVEDGGGLVLLPASDADLNYLNRYLLPELLSARLQGVVHTPSGTGSPGLAPASSGLFFGLLHDGPDDQARFSSSFSITPGADTHPLLNFSDGRPALIHEWKGAGRIALWAAPLDLKWNDLPFKGVFVPAMQRLTRFLALPPEHAAHYMVGQSVRRFVSGLEPDAGLQAESPSGRRLFLGAETTGGRHYWTIPRLDEAGIWRLLLQGEEVDRFAVNLDPDESDLAPADPEYLVKILGAGRTHILAPDADWASTVLSLRHGRELWREFLLAAAVLLLVELWLARAPRSGSLEKSAA